MELLGFRRKRLNQLRICQLCITPSVAKKLSCNEVGLAMTGATSMVKRVNSDTGKNVSRKP